MDDRDYKFYVQPPLKEIYGKGIPYWKACLFRRSKLFTTHWDLIFSAQADSQVEVYSKLAKYIATLGTKEKFEIKEW